MKPHYPFLLTIFNFYDIIIIDKEIIDMNAKEFRDNWCNHNFPIAHNQMYIIENGEQKIEELSRYAMKLLTYKVLKEELTNPEVFSNGTDFQKEILDKEQELERIVNKYYEIFGCDQL